MFKNKGISSPKTVFEKNYPNTCSFLRRYVYHDLTKITSVWFDIDEDVKEVHAYFYNKKKISMEWTPFNEIFLQEYTSDNNKKILLYLFDSEKELEAFL